MDARGRTRTSRLVIALEDSVLRAVMDPPAGGTFEYATELMEGPTGGASGWQPQPFWVHGDLLSIQFRSLNGAHMVLALEIGNLSVLKGRIGECDAPFIPNVYAQPDASAPSHCYSGNFTATKLAGS